MRILMLAQFYPPYLGGEERHVQDLSTELAKRGHRVSVATLWHPGLKTFEVEQGVRIYRIRGSMMRMERLFSDRSHRHAPPFPDPESTAALRQVIVQEQPQIVHAHNWLIHSFLPLKHFSRAKLALSLHDYSLVCAKKKLVYEDLPCSGSAIPKCLGCASDHYGAVKGLPTLFANWVSGCFERAAVDLFLPVSQATALGNGLVHSGLPYQVIPNFITDERAAAGDELDSYRRQLPAEPFFLFVGALGRHKGVDVLLQAYAGLREAPPLVLIGYETAEYPVNLNSLPQNTIVLKNWPHAAVMEAWRRSLIGLIPSTCLETFGIVVLEAMQNGRPVIASQIGGLAEIVIEGENGFLVPPGEHQALQRAIQRMMDEPDLRERMGQSAQRGVKKYLASTILPEFERVYELLLGKRTLPGTPAFPEP